MRNLRCHSLSLGVKPSVMFISIWLFFVKGDLYL